MQLKNNIYTLVIKFQKVLKIINSIVFTIYGDTTLSRRDIKK